MTETIETSSPIGAFFTPLAEARKIVNGKLYRRWRDGAVIFDPTAGIGNFLEAFIAEAIEEDGKPPTVSLLKNLYGMEREQEFVDLFFQRMAEIYGITFPRENFLCGDFLFSPPTIKADILLGNPPWLNFCDLEGNYKEKVKSLFVRSGLTGNKKNLLLGNSRIDIASLVVLEAIRNNLKPGNDAFFFLPLSLFLGDGAHSRFRILLDEEKIALNRIDDYRDSKLFSGVSTRYGFASFTKGKKTEFPVKYRVIRRDGPVENLEASPVSSPGSPLLIGGSRLKTELPLLELAPRSKPRQGLNTCGANDLFIFDSCQSAGKGLLKLSNKSGEAILPDELIFPLIGSGQFRGKNEHRFVFLPYNREGRVLSPEELSRFPEAQKYLDINRPRLENRKGVLIGASIARGTWWSLLGVGPYSFAPWKVVWEAYGKRDFVPRLFSEKEGKLWQPNQALQAFIPHDTEEEAKETLGRLTDPRIADILRGQGMEGTCNWAQPGRIMKFIRLRKRD